MQSFNNIIIQYKQCIFLGVACFYHWKFLFLIPITDGSLTAYNVAVVDGENFTYINSETDATVWPGLWGSIINGLSTCILVVTKP